MSRLPCFVRLPILIATLFFLTFNHSMASAAGKSWQTGEGADPANDGRPVAWLDYGVPETDDIQVRIACKAQDAGAPELDAVFGAALGDLKNGADAALKFSGGGFDHEVPGTAHGVGAEVGIAGVKLDAGIDDPLWDALTEKDALRYSIEGQPAADLPLKDGHRRIGNFVEACRSFVREEPVRTAEAKPEKDENSPGGDISEKDAYEAAKELGTIEAWEAFLENFPDGFRADLARAYVKRIGSEGSAPSATPDAPETAQAPPPPPPATADISLAMTSDGSCRGGRNCSVTVTATNAGGEPFSGDLTIATSVAPGGAELQGTGTPPFSCEGAGGGAICSTGAANIAPGQSATIPLVFTLPRNAGGQVTTCASIAWGGVPAALGAADVQRKLNELGFDAGPVDGRPGRQTVTAIRAFQQSAGIQETGEIDLPLLLALFAPGGPGDANPVNDQACAGAAVSSAPPLLAAFQGPACPLGQVIRENGQCGCPSSVPVWTGTSCMPRLARNCNRGRVYDKSQKLCVCPGSRPHWYNNRCHARFDDCPGDSVRVGDKCLKENDPGFQARPRPRPSGPNLNAGCSGNSIRIGNVCVNIANAPVFGGRPGRGGGQTFTGGGNRPNRPQGGGQAATSNKLSEAQVRAELLSHCNALGLDGMRAPGTNKRAFNSCAQSSASMARQVMTVPQTANISQRQAINGFKEELNGAAAAYKKTIAKQNQQGGQTATQQGGALKCPAGQVASLWGCVKQPIPNCPPGVLHRVTPDRRVHCDNAVPPPVIKAAPPPPHVVNKVRPQNTGPKICAAGQLANNCTCPPGLAKDTHSSTSYPCKPACPAGQAWMLGLCCSTKWGRDVKGCKGPPAAAGIKCGPGMVAQGNTCVSAKPQGGVTKQILCPSNLVPQNGKCGCAPGLTWNGKVCAAPQQKRAAPPPSPKLIQQQQKQQQLQQNVACSGGGQVINGRCVCPASRPRLENGKCKKASSANRFIQQLQQQQTQPQQPQQQQQQQQPPQNQQQQQIQKLNNILNQLSDRRLKRDIELVETRADGLKLYSFRYLWDERTFVGVMAQDLLTDPARAEAVSLHESGYYMADYGKLGLEMTVLKNGAAAGR